MPITPYTVDRFDGLNLMDDPLDVGAGTATALSNVVLTTPGAVKTRDGWTPLSTSATATAIKGLAYYKAISGTEYILAGDSTTVYPFNLSTGVVGTTSAIVTTGGNNSFARFGNESNTRMYIGGGGLYRLDATTFTTVSVSGPGGISIAYVAVVPNDNRLAVATNILGSSAPGERVYFSAAGDPETFSTNDYVGVTPGDGEPITALCPWGGYLFAFKRTKFAVFTSTSVSGTGSPVFNYRMVEAGQGANEGAVVTGDDGVYFANNSGVYATSGGPPVYLSRALEPWIRAGTYSGLPSLSMANLTLAYFARVLYVTDRTNQTTLAYDTVRQAWSVWSLGATAGIAVPISSSLGGIYFGETGTKKVARVTGTTDNGSAISWSWKSGKYPLGDPGQVAVASETSLDGYGTVTLGMGSDLYPDQSGSATLGTSPTVAEGWPAGVDQEGRWMQMTLSGSGPAQVNRVTHHVTHAKAAGMR